MLKRFAILNCQFRRRRTRWCGTLRNLAPSRSGARTDWRHPFKTRKTGQLRVPPLLPMTDASGTLFGKQGLLKKLRFLVGESRQTPCQPKGTNGNVPWKLTAPAIFVATEMRMNIMHVISCTKSKALRSEMRKIWDLPSELQFRYTGVDWLQNLLGTCNMEMRVKTLLLLWRCWFLRDDCIHNTGKEVISRSVHFLKQYEEELNICYMVLSSGPKEKQALGRTEFALAGKDRTEFEAIGAMQQENDLDLASGGAIQWIPPDDDTVKLNTDASFLADSGVSHVGAVARDHRGLVLFSLSKGIDRCSSVEEAEARGLLCGLQTLTALYRGPIIAETDCLFLTKELQPNSCNRSVCFSVLHDIKEELKKFQGAQVIYTNRKQNKLAHCLAARARSKGGMQWMANVPEDLRAVLTADCLVGSRVM